jgi:hypothetical protein
MQWSELNERKQFQYFIGAHMFMNIEKFPLRVLKMCYQKNEIQASLPPPLLWNT